MSFNEICNEIRVLKSSDEELAFEKLYDVLVEFLKEYSCDNVFHLYLIDKKNNYQRFREDTEVIFGLLYFMFYDEELLNEESNDDDPTTKEELDNYLNFLESIQFIQQHVRSISFEEEESIQVKCFHKYMNYCKTFIENMYKNMQELNDVMDEMSNKLEELTNKLTNLVGQTV